MSDRIILRDVDKFYGEVLGVNPQKGYVCAGVAADQFRVELPAVLERHDNALTILNDMMVGEDIAFIRINDDPGPRTHLSAGLRLLRRRLHVKEAPEERVVEQRVHLDRATAFDGNIDNGGRHFC